MKVAVLTHKIDGNRLVFKADRVAVDKSLDELRSEGDFTEKFSNMNFERFAIRKSMEIDKLSLSKDFKK